MYCARDVVDITRLSRFESIYFYTFAFLLPRLVFACVVHLRRFRFEHKNSRSSARARDKTRSALIGANTRQEQSKVFSHRPSQVNRLNGDYLFIFTAARQRSVVNLENASPVTDCHHIFICQRIRRIVSAYVMNARCNEVMTRCRLTNIDSLRKWQRKSFHARRTKRSGARSGVATICSFCFPSCHWSIDWWHFGCARANTRKLVSCSCVRRDRIINGRVNHLEKCIFLAVLLSVSSKRCHQKL